MGRGLWEGGSGPWAAWDSPLTPKQTTSSLSVVLGSGRGELIPDSARSGAHEKRRKQVLPLATCRALGQVLSREGSR